MLYQRSCVVECANVTCKSQATINGDSSGTDYANGNDGYPSGCDDCSANCRSTGCSRNCDVSDCKSTCSGYCIYDNSCASYCGQSSCVYGRCSNASCKNECTSNCGNLCSSGGCTESCYNSACKNGCVGSCTACTGGCSDNNKEKRPLIMRGLAYYLLISNGVIPTDLGFSD